MESSIDQLLQQAASASTIAHVEIVKAMGYTDLAEGCRRLDCHLQGLEYDPEFLEQLAQALSIPSRKGEASTSTDSESGDSSHLSTPAINLGEGLKISPEAEELVAAIVNAPFGRSELPLSSDALGEVRARLSAAAPLSANQAVLEKGKLYTVVGESMTCSIGVRSKRLIALQDLNGEPFSFLLCFAPEDFDGVSFADHQTVCVGQYVRDLDGTPVFLPVLVFGPSAKSDLLIVIRPAYGHTVG